MNNDERLRKFDAVTLNALRGEINKALEALGEKYGIAIDAGRATYYGPNATFKLELSTMQDDGAVMTKDATTFIQYAKILGLQVSDLGRVFELAGRKFKLIGYNTKKRKYPFITECLNDGKHYCFGDTLIQEKFKEKKND